MIRRKRNKALKAKIIEKFWNQGRFADKLEIQESLVSKVINGKMELPEKEKEVWAKALDCNKEDIFPYWLYV